MIRPLGVPKQHEPTPLGDNARPINRHVPYFRPEPKPLPSWLTFPARYPRAWLALLVAAMLVLLFLVTSDAQAQDWVSNSGSWGPDCGAGSGDKWYNEKPCVMDDPKSGWDYFGALLLTVALVGIFLACVTEWIFCGALVW